MSVRRRISGFSRFVGGQAHLTIKCEGGLMNRHKISPNAIVVALFGLVISSYVGITNKSILGFFILILLTIVGAVLVNRIKNRHQE